MVCVMVMCRPVSSRRMTPLVKNLPLVRGGDLQLLAVFGDGAPRELEPFALEDADDLRIAQRLPRILLLDDFADPLLDGVDRKCTRLNYSHLVILYYLYFLI